MGGMASYMIHLLDDILVNLGEIKPSSHPHVLFINSTGIFPRP